jgi:hypothetical protein
MEWPEGGPKVLWRVPGATGWASISSVGDDVLVAGMEGGGGESIRCLDANTGKEKWKHQYAFRGALSAMRWDDVPEKKRASAEKKIAKLARKIEKAAAHPEKLHAPLFRSFFMKIMSGMMKKNTWNLRDRKHWEDNGWLGGK